MAINNSLKDLPELKKSVLTIGTFDGVHLGHQKLFEILNNKALATNSESVVITFNPHPQHIIGKGLNPKRLLTGIEEKVFQIKKLFRFVSCILRFSNIDRYKIYTVNRAWLYT